MLRISLVDYLAARNNCVFISDLTHLNFIGKMRLAAVVNEIQPKDCSLHEWNDALQYIVAERPVDSPEVAKKNLLIALQCAR